MDGIDGPKSGASTCSAAARDRRHAPERSEVSSFQPLSHSMSVKRDGKLSDRVPCHRRSDGKRQFRRAASENGHCARDVGKVGFLAFACASTCPMRASVGTILAAAPGGKDCTSAMLEMQRRSQPPRVHAPTARSSTRARHCERRSSQTTASMFPTIKGRRARRSRPSARRPDRQQNNNGDGPQKRRCKTAHRLLRIAKPMRVQRGDPHWCYKCER